MNVSKVEEMEYLTPTMSGVENVKMQWLLKGENFHMRRFVIGGNGKVPMHTHDWEHEVYVLSGKGRILYLDEKHDVEADSIAFIDGTKPHGFENTGEKDFIFMCCIPNI